MSTIANVPRALRPPRWLWRTLRRRRALLRRQLGHAAARPWRAALEHLRRASAPRAGSFSFGDLPDDPRARRRPLRPAVARGRGLPAADAVRARLLAAARTGRARLLSAARVPFYVTCACGAILGYLLFTLLVV
jgi:hypothetical protein